MINFPFGTNLLFLGVPVIKPHYSIALLNTYQEHQKAFRSEKAQIRENLDVYDNVWPCLFQPMKILYGAAVGGEVQI